MSEFSPRFSLRFGRRALSPPLTPPNATALEEEMARLSGRLDMIDPSAIETIWDAARCPASMLPWLAWAVSVDVWDGGWSEAVQRAVIAASMDVHRLKGTRAAVMAALSAMTLDSSVVEWWEQAPPGRRGTYIVTVMATDASTGDVLAQARRGLAAVRAAKPKSRAMSGRIAVTTTASLRIGAVQRIGGVVRHPRRVAEDQSQAAMVWIGAHQRVGGRVTHPRAAPPEPIWLDHLRWDDQAGWPGGVA